MQKRSTSGDSEVITLAGSPQHSRKKNLPKRDPPKKASYIFGNLLGRRLKRGTSSDKEFDDRREYFTAWLSFVQIVIMVVVLIIYPFAPVGIDVKDVQQDILLSR